MTPVTDGRATTRDGRALHLVRAGSGHPTVVLDAGMGATRSSWALVLPLVAARTEVVAYDRAGLGRSEPAGGRERPLAALAADLVDLLGTLDGPVVLVGHSHGGLVVRAAAAQVPDRVAGIVLVDASDEGCDRFFRAPPRVTQRLSAGLLPLAARTGMLRAAARRMAAPLPPGDAAELVAETSTVPSAKAFAAELRPFSTDLAAWRDDPPAEAPCPLTVITGTAPTRSQRRNREALLAAHVARAAAHPGGRHVRAEASDHLVLVTEPELVADEVLRLVEGARPA